MSGIPGSFPFLLLALVVALSSVPLSYFRTPKPEPVAAPAPPQIETRIQAEGLDSHARRLPFTVYVLSQNFSWKLESATDLEGEKTLLSPELAGAVSRAQDVFCIGTASFEGATKMEEARAARRADTLARWIAGAVTDTQGTHLFRVNAGQYTGPKELESSSQRKAIVIATQGHPDDVNLGEALKSGLQKQQHEYPVVYSLLHHYSRSGDWLQRLD